MGLDVTFHEKITKVDHPEGHTPDDDCWDSHEVVWAKDFPVQADDLVHKSCYTSGGETLGIHHSYSGYNQYRAWLCMAMLGVPPEAVWNDPEKYAGRPFYEQINFADNEGTIGPKTSAKLAEDYRQQRDYIEQRMRAIPKPFDGGDYDHQRNIEYMIVKYDEWAKGFALAADTGMVVFH